MSPEITVEKIVAVGKLKTQDGEEMNYILLKGSDGERYAMRTELLPEGPPITRGSIIRFTSAIEDKKGLKVITRSLGDPDTDIEVLPPLKTT